MAKYLVKGRVFKETGDEKFLLNGAILNTATSGVTHYSLTAEAGSYALTGTAATLTATREIAAAAGSYALSGTAATLTTTRELAAGAGSYSLSGTAAALTAARELAAGAGSYGLSGTAATLTYTPAAGAFELIAEAGSYSLSGTAATLTATRELSAAAGSYALSGTAATLTYTPVTAFELTAEAGAYALSGGDATFNYTAIPGDREPPEDLAPPPSRVPFVDKNGLNDRTWIKWLYDIYEKLRGPLWYDMLAPITSAGRRGGTSDFDWTNYNGTGIYQPDFAINEDGIANFHINHDIKPKSDIYPHVHWSSDGTDSNPVHWELNYIYAGRDDDSPIVFSAKQTITLIGVNSGSAYSHIVTEVSDGNAFEAPEVDSIMMFQIKRVTNGATENTDTIFAHFLDIHYQRDRFGTPGKAPDFYKR